MATTPTKPEVEVRPQTERAEGYVWPRELGPEPAAPETMAQDRARKPSSRDALQALIAFSALHNQVRRRKALAAKYVVFDAPPAAEFEAEELFALDEVLQLVAERAVAITGADGLAIALAENDEIRLRAAAGSIRPDVGARMDRDSAFSGACFRTAQIIRCDDTETDSRVNLAACRHLGARSMVAVPLCGRRRVIGLLEAFSSEPLGFNESDIRNLELLAEIILGALKPEDEDRFAQSAGVAATALAPTPQMEPAIAIPAASVSTPILNSSVPHGAFFEALVPTRDEPLVEPADTAIATQVLLPVAVEEPLAPAQPETTARRSPVIANSAPEIVEPPAATTDTADRLPVADMHDTLAFESLLAPAQTSRPGVVLLLVLVVVAAVVAGGIWWKVKTAQLSQAMIHPAPRANVRPESAANKRVGANPSDPVASIIAPSQVAQPASGLANSSSFDAAPAGVTAATPQEMAHMPHVKSVRHWSSGDASTVVLDLDDQVQYEAHRLTGPDRIYFDLHDTSLAPDLENKTEDIGDAMLARVRLAQPVPGITRLVLETKGESSFSVSLEPSPYRLVVTIRKPGTEPKSRTALFPGQSDADRQKLAIVIPPPTKDDLQLRVHVPKMRVVVDAGHGGWDLGTVGRQGLLEKDVVFEVAQRLGKLLESRLGFEVLYTRSDDSYIPLDQRAALANQFQADLFVSVHANYSDLPSARGVETYYSRSFASATHPPADGGKAVVPVVLSSADLREKVQDSERLAASVQRSLYATVSAQNPGIRDRGIKPAGFAVLNQTTMPGILAEISFVSSPTDEQKLRSDGYREQIAEALYRGIAHYAASSHGLKVASSGR